jgi:hypothetical protein
VLAKSGRLRAVCTSSRHPRGIQSLLVLFLALGGLTRQLPGSPDSRYGQIPLTFIENRGQTHASVHFLAKGPGMTAYFTSSEVVVDLHPSVVRMRYLGGKAAPDVGGLDPQEGRVNYLIGADPSKWKTDVPLYGRVIYRDLYPGIDMVYSAQARWLKSEFVAAPGADTSRIRIEYAGVQSIRTDENGRLVLVTANGELREEAPEIYQESGGVRIPVEGAFRVSGNVVSFEVGEYDHSRELRIDPVLSYSTYLGGSGTDKGNAIAVDSTGAAYVTGYTDSSNFPVTAGVVQGVYGGNVNAFITKLNAAGSAIVYSTYLGGNGDDQGCSIAVDGTGNAYVTGWTTSPNFPLVAAVQASFGGMRNAFVSKLNPAGTALVYSTYLGGAGTDSGNGIALDSTNAAYVTGSTTSTNFPVVGAIHSTSAGGMDAFVTKLSPSGGVIDYSTYLGGAAGDQGSSIAVDSTGAAYIAGTTSSTNFPTVSAFQAANGGAQDGFVAKLNPAGSALVYSTYLGGSGVENVELGRSIAVDSSGCAYVVGTTSSANFPTFQPEQAALNGSQDAFVVKLSSTGSALVYGTYLGGSSIDYGESIAVDGSGFTYVAGYTASPDFPIVNGDQPANGGGYDAFLVKLNTAGSAIVESDFLGGSGNDAAYGIALDSTASAYLTGQTLSSNFPLKPPVQNSLGSMLAAFVAKFTFGSLTPASAVSATPSGTGANQAFTLVYADPRGTSDISWVEAEWNATQSNAGACYVHYIASSNTIQLSSDGGTGWIGPVTVGTAGTLQNSQCVLDAGSSSASVSGNSLTLDVALTFLPAFAGTKNIYMQVQSAVAGLTAWQARGTWTVVSAPPASVSVTPSSGSGLNQTFSFVYTDPYGVGDISWVQMHFQTQLVAQSACYLQYTRSTNTIVLINDAGTGSVGSAILGLSGTLSNSQCTLNAAGSSTSSTGNNLTVNLALSFAGAFVGGKNISMGVIDNANVFSGWQQMGAWTVPAGGSLPPANVSASPSSGSGSSQTFSYVFSDPYGAANISWVQMHFQTQLVANGACYLQYTRSTNTVVLINDAGTGNAGSIALGSSGTLSNSQCTFNSAGSSASVSGNNLTVNLALIFKPAFAGTKNISMGAIDNTNIFSGWQQLGSWTVTTADNLPPAPASVTPASGAGSSQTFSLVYSDPYGYGDLSWVQVDFQTTLTGANACYLQYTRSTNTIQLINDAGTGYVGSGGTLGSVGTLVNSQCTLTLASSSTAISGNNLTVNVALSFTAAFQGSKNIYMGAVNNGNVASGWQQTGSWTATQAGNLPPTNLSVTPSSGSGLTQTFAFIYSDPYGYTDLNWVQLNFQTQLVAQNACYAQYTISTNTIQLINDAGTGYAGSGGTLGSAGALANSQCTLNLASSSASGSSNNLTLNLSITFNSGFTGSKNVSMSAVDNATVFSGWQQMGTWTP